MDYLKGSQSSLDKMFQSHFKVCQSQQKMQQAKEQTHIKKRERERLKEKVCCDVHFLKKPATKIALKEDQKEQKVKKYSNLKTYQQTYKMHKGNIDRHFTKVSYAM